MAKFRSLVLCLLDSIFWMLCFSIFELFMAVNTKYVLPWITFMLSTAFPVVILCPYLLPLSPYLSVICIIFPPLFNLLIFNSFFSHHLKNFLLLVLEVLSEKARFQDCRFDCFYCVRISPEIGGNVSFNQKLVANNCCYTNTHTCTHKQKPKEKEREK